LLPLSRLQLTNNFIFAGYDRVNATKVQPPANRAPLGDEPTLLPQAARVNAASQNDSTADPGKQTAPVTCVSDRPSTPRGPKRVLILDAPPRVGAEGCNQRHHYL